MVCGTESWLGGVSTLCGTESWLFTEFEVFPVFCCSSNCGVMPEGPVIWLF
jgi:hypothetical protein